MVCRDEIVEHQGCYTIVLIIASYKGSAAACKTSYHRLFRLGKGSLVWVLPYSLLLGTVAHHTSGSHLWKKL